VVKCLRQQNHYIVIDLPHDFNAVTLAALDQADRILLLLSPELAAVRCASIALDVFHQLGYPQERFKLVLNWTFKGKGLPRSEIEKTLGQNIGVVIPFVEESLVAALTLGKPPVYQDPTSPVGALFEDLAYYCSKEEHKHHPPQPVSEAYRRIRRRAKTKQQ
jgi:pilus assembly protein CpaE